MPKPSYTVEIPTSRPNDDRLNKNPIFIILFSLCFTFPFFSQSFSQIQQQSISFHISTLLTHRFCSKSIIFVIQLIMSKLVNRFWDWIFHPSIRKHVHPQGKAISYRYPSPGNAPLDAVQNQEEPDYKTPYEHSHHYVRYQKPTPMQTSQTYVHVKEASINTDPIMRLKRGGCLKRGEENDPDKVAAAKAKFQQKFGFTADQTTYSNTQNYNILQSKSREDIAAYIQSFYQEVRHSKEQSLDCASIRSTIDDPEVVPMESVDMFTAPHIQQGRIANQYMIDFLIDQNVQKKQIDMYAGDQRFWKAIDDAYATSEVEKVQKHLGDQEPTEFELRAGKIELQFDKEGNVVDLHQKS